MIYLNEAEVKVAIANYCGTTCDKVQLIYTYDTGGTCYVEADVDKED